MMKKIDSRKISWVTFGIIIAIGIFLRTIHFGDWLVFKSDQARDAIIIEKALADGFKHLPLMGPQVGGTPFRLGPVHYYFQYFSVKIFKIFPESLAYPDLLWGILTLPLIFMLMRKFFLTSVSLWLMALASTSLFLVTFSRFGWNPNGLPFFTALFAWLFLTALENTGKKRFLLLTGAALCLGIIAQLHFAAILGLGVGLLFFLIFFRPLSWHEIILGVFIIIACHLPVIINEYQTDGGNTQEFLKAFSKKESVGEKHGWYEKLFRAYQENSKIFWLTITGKQNTDLILTRNFSIKCDQKCQAALPYSFSAMILLAYVLAATYFSLRSIKDVFKKQALYFFVFWFGGFFILTIFLAYQLETRFYLGAVTPLFILLGFAFERTANLNKKNWLSLSLLAVGVILILSNLQSTVKYLQELSMSQVSAKESGRDLRFGTAPKVTLGQLKKISADASQYFKNDKPVIISGQRLYTRSLAIIMSAKQGYSGCYFRGQKQSIPTGYNLLLLSYADNSDLDESGWIFYGTLAAKFIPSDNPQNNLLISEDCFIF